MRYLLALVVCGSLLAGAKAARAADTVDFNRDIRPLLAENCFACHGHDEKHREGGLRLDVRDVATAKMESGAKAIVPGDLTKSELVARITSDDAETHMPPKKSGKKLKPADIEKLKQWVAAGAPYANHWSFVAPVRAELPAVKQAAAARNAIDRFLLARLEKEGLNFSPEADKTTLIRRLSLDLTGLPPTPAEVDAFVADKSTDAYEKLVDRLLDSTHYGERMAMMWLDFARYADSNGFQTDTSRQMWPWRDWVIRAFNNDMPYDQFTIEQLAGDLLPNATKSQLVATGFNRNHRINGEGGLIAAEWRIENIIDRVDTTGLTWMGLTLGCARCHDHKFDPITQKEFYQLFAYFNNVPESGTMEGASNRKGGNSPPVVDVPTSEQEVELAKKQGRVKELETAVAEAKKALPEWTRKWEASFREGGDDASTSMWTALDVHEVTSKDKNTKWTRQADGAWLASGANPDLDVYEATAPLAAGKLSGILLEAFPDPSLPQQSLGRNDNGNFVLSAVEVEIEAPSLPKPVKGTVARVQADYSQAGWDISLVLDKLPKNGWAVDGPTKKEPRQAMFVLQKALVVPEQATIHVRLKHDAIARHNIGRFRLSATPAEPRLVTLDGKNEPSKKIKAILAVADDKRTPQQKAELDMFLRTDADYPLREPEAELAAAKKEVTDLEGDFPTSMIMKEGEKPRDAFLLIRGQYDKPGDKVTAALPAALPPLPEGAPNNRLGLAQWLVSPQHPLTSRVFVNRVWERLFGTGIVKSSENFGTQSEYPSHPELLDWLAVEFREPTVLPAVSGRAAKPWDIKSLIKLIVTSAAYRQQSQTSPALVEKDPENRLLAHGPRFRLPAEIIRDQALAVSGLYADTVGGPSVRPYMPEGVWDETSVYGDLLRYKRDGGDGLYRRTMYTIWKRTAAPPTMLMFDSPSRELCVVKRSRTNTPLQALSLLNEITFVEAARALAQKMVLEGGAKPADRIAFGFRRATARVPSADELKIILAGHERRLAKFKADPESAKKLLGFGDSKRNETLDAVDLAAYTLTANVLLNLDETVTKE